MKYLIAIILLLCISFVTILISTSKIDEKSNLKENLKRSGIAMLFMLPLVSLIGGTFFLLFELVVTLLGVDIYYLDVFVIAIYGVFIIFICDFLSKIIISTISSNIFSKKYGAENLTESEMMSIFQRNQNHFNFWTYVLIFLISFALYAVVLNLLSVVINTVFIAIISVMNSLGYKLFFRNKSSINMK